MVRKRSWPAVSHYIKSKILFAGELFSRQAARFSFSKLRNGYEINANSVVEGSGEVVIYITHEHAGFTHSAIADDEQFEQLGVAD